MDIRVKRIYEPPSQDDGARFLVDRLWARGLSKDKAALTGWLKTVAPSSDLRKRLHAGAVSWEAFVSAYLAELQGEEAQAGLETLRAAAAKGPVTLLFARKLSERNHATVLRDYLLKG